MNWELLLNSVLVSGLAALLAVLLGSLAAVWAAGLSAPWRYGFVGVAVATFALPPFLVTNCWLSLLGHTGAWRSWLPVSVYSPGGAVGVLALLLWPVPFLAAFGAWENLEPGLVESDPAAHGGAFLRQVLWPVAAPALERSAALVFVLALNNFAVPAILQVKVFPAEFWVRFSTQLDYLGALLLSWPMVLGPLALLAWLRRQNLAWPRWEGGVTPRVLARQVGSCWRALSGGAALLLLGLGLLLPVGQLMFSGRTWTQLEPAFAAGRGAVLTSFALAIAVATVTLGLGVAGWRLRVGMLVWLPLLVPGVLLGVLLIFALNRPPFLMLYRSAGIMVLALSLRYLAIGWHGAAVARQAVDPGLTDDARLCGAGGWQLWRHVHWPQMAPALASAWYVIYLLCLWDVETLVLIVPPGGETLAVRVFNLLHYGHNAQVSALCLLLLGLAILPLACWLAVRWLRRPGVVLALGVLAGLGSAGCSPTSETGRELSSKLFGRVEVLGARGTAPGQFNKPRSVAVDAADNLYVVDLTGRVQKFSPRGEFLAFWQMPQTDLGKPKGMCRDGQGRVVVIEPHYARVNHFATDGKLVFRWGANGTNAGQLAFPRAVAVNRAGDLYVSEYGRAERIQRFSADGTKCLGGWGRFGSGPGEFNRAEGLGFDGHDRLYVADSCNHRIQVFGADGRWLRSHGRAGAGPGEFSYPYDVRVDAAGCQFVCEFGNSRLQVLDEHDRPVERLGGPGSAPGQFSNPWSIALDSAGNLYVADAGNHRVQKFLRRKTTPAAWGRPGGSLHAAVAGRGP